MRLEAHIRGYSCKRASKRLRFFAPVSRSVWPMYSICLDCASPRYFMLIMNIATAPSMIPSSVANTPKYSIWTSMERSGISMSVWYPHIWLRFSFSLLAHRPRRFSSMIRTGGKSRRGYQGPRA